MNYPIGRLLELNVIIQDSQLSQSSRTSALTNMMSERFILTSPPMQTPAKPSTAQKKCTRKSFASTEKSSSKKVKKTGGKKKTSSTLKQLIKELLTDNPSKSLEEINESASSFLQLSKRIDHAETKNEEASQGFIFSYFNFGKAVFKRYKELKPEFGKDESEAIVKKKVRMAILEIKYSDETLQKKTERSKKLGQAYPSEK
ncbi:hypothetical protein C1646_756862 [Rhizophagus diaphanus]|nr:hypothetical protein C1646_756862 [Rhizophagus diaphanus] [Rhizophagus sp. MUCL 43196]